MPEVTNWYPGHIKPLKDRPGEYERKYDDGCLERQWWDGRDFYIDRFFGPSMYQNLPWRGLTERGMKEARK